MKIIISRAMMMAFIVFGIFITFKSAQADELVGDIQAIDPVSHYFILVRTGGSTTQAAVAEKDFAKPNANSVSDAGQLEQTMGNPQVKREYSNEKIKVVVLPTTQLQEFSSLNELKPGDELKIDAKYNQQTGSWEASTVRIAKVVLHDEK